MYSVRTGKKATSIVIVRKVVIVTVDSMENGTRALVIQVAAGIKRLGEITRDGVNGKIGVLVVDPVKAFAPPGIVRPVILFRCHVYI